jgi:ABC-type phosphate/phosphonate transport system permease subunit
VDTLEIEYSSGHQLPTEHHWKEKNRNNQQPTTTTNSAAVAVAAAVAAVAAEVVAAAMAMDQTLIKTINKLQDAFSSVSTPPSSHLTAIH